MKRSITIDNRTAYSPKSLRALFSAVHAHFLLLHDEPKRVSVSVRRARKYVRGYAWLNSSRLRIYLTNDKRSWHDKHKTFEQLVAMIFYHELMHCDGLEHKDMAHKHLDHMNFEYADSYPLVKAERERKQKASDSEVMLALCERRARWLTKLKRAQTAIKRIDKSLKYYKQKGQHHATIHTHTHSERAA